MHTDNTTSALSNTITANANFGSATGPVPIRMNNDYLFRALLQRSNQIPRCKQRGI